MIGRDPCHSSRRLVPIFLLSLLAPTPGSSLAGEPEDIQLQTVISGLTEPVAVRHAGDGSGRLFVVERAGRILVWDGIQTSTFLDITNQVESGGHIEQGLLGLAFHPSYETNGYFYVYYTYPPGDGTDWTRISRFSVTPANSNEADADSEIFILEYEQDRETHNAGDIHFGPDGYLYIASGDGGIRKDENNRAQDLGQLLGKMLRIDVDGIPAGGNGVEYCGLVTNYAIPPDNPFVGDGNSCDEIWAYGLRNPWRFSFDRHTGDIFISDVGFGQREEISFQPASSAGGENYGWSCKEGTLVRDFNPCVPPSPLVDPIVEYAHEGELCAVMGGFRYRGTRLSGFYGTYVYADHCTGYIYFATESQGDWSSVRSSLAVGPIGPSSFGEDEDGELYVVDLNGSVLQFTSSSSIFTDGFESGDTSSWSTQFPWIPPAAKR